MEALQQQINASNQLERTRITSLQLASSQASSSTPRAARAARDMSPLPLRNIEEKSFLCDPKVAQKANIFLEHLSRGSGITRLQKESVSTSRPLQNTPKNTQSTSSEHLLQGPGRKFEPQTFQQHAALRRASRRTTSPSLSPPPTYRSESPAREAVSQSQRYYTSCMYPPPDE
jgi:hypothetical protein